MLYDSFFKEIFDPDVKPERLEELLSLLLKQRVKILKVLPNDSTRIADESSLLIMDIVVQLEDGSIANVECQRIGYKFPGQRSACYSADLLLRQYKRVRGEKGKKFSYKDIKKVYSIIFYEQSPKEFHAFPNDSIHYSKQKTNTGVEVELLQEFLFIPLDIMKKIYENNGIRNKLEAWLIFLSDDNPETIIRLLEEYPEFREMYEEVYDSETGEWVVTEVVDTKTFDYTVGATAEEEQEIIRPNTILSIIIGLFQELLKLLGIGG